MKTSLTAAKRHRGIALITTMAALVVVMMLVGAFLATRIDGQPMRVKDKGPIWIVYPWSGNPALDTPPFHARSIWQLRSLRVE